MKCSFSLPSLKKGSSLLITLLVLSAASGLILVASQNVLDSSRAVATLDNARLAKQMAYAGIEEGMLRLTTMNGPQPAGVNANGEYGDGATAPQSAPYSLLPMRRGFSLGTTPACSQLEMDRPLTTATFDPACPYYDLTIRRFMGTNFNPAPAMFGYSSRELPLNQEVRLDVLKLDSVVTLVPNFADNTVGSITVKKCNAGGCFASVTINNLLFVNLSSLEGITNIRITVNGSALLADPLLDNPGVKIYSSFPGGVLVIDKGYTTIDATGVAGGVEHKLILYKRNFDPNTGGATRNLLDFGGTFDFRGALQ